VKRNLPDIAFVLLAAVSGMLIWGTLTRGHNWGGDFAAYCMQAKSLLEGGVHDFFRENRDSMERSSEPLGPPAYPWGFPLLLVPAWAVFGCDLLALKTVGGTCFLLFLFVLWFGFRKTHSPPWRFALVGLFALNPLLIGFSNQLLSDLPFLLFSTAAMLLINRWVEPRRDPDSRGAGEAAVLGLCVFAAFFVRANGILLAFTLAASQALSLFASARRRRPDAKIFPARSLALNVLPHAVFVVAVAATGILLPSGETAHLALLCKATLESIRSHAAYYLSLPAGFFTGVPGAFALYAASVPFAVAGAVSRRRSDYPMLIYIVLTFALYVLWPPIQGIRFLLPLLPFYCSFVMSGLEAFVRCGGSGFLRRACGVSVAAVLLFAIAFLAARSITRARENILARREYARGPFTGSAQALFSFIRENTGANETIVFFKPRVMRFLTRRPSLMIREAEAIGRGDLFCYYRGANARFQPPLSKIEQYAGAGALSLVFENRDFRVYRVRTNGTEPTRPGSGEKR
jgi:hypothetical protein